MDSLDRSCSSLPPFQSAYFSKAKGVRLSQRLDLCSLAYANPTHAQWMGDREITKNSFGIFGRRSSLQWP